MRTLYPEIRPYHNFSLAVDPPHELHVEECGNAQGVPALFLHGGPGAGLAPTARRFFDPKRYRIVLFDQRGAGKSTPHAELGGNTTQALIDDIERIRIELEIDQWLVFGGSWGSTLALAYAQAHPSRVSALVLRGIFLCRPEDIHWFYQDGASRLFPDAWKHYRDYIAEDEHHNMVSAYYKRLTGSDEIARMHAAKEWALWEGRTATLHPDSHVIEHFSDPHVALSLARIECHYFMNNSFLEPNQLLRDAHKLKGIPGVIVHGRYDVICPLDGAWALKDAWGDDAELHIIRDAGHAATEPGTIDALIRATDYFANKIA